MVTSVVVVVVVEVVDVVVVVVAVVVVVVVVITSETGSSICYAFLSDSGFQSECREMHHHNCKASS